MYSFIYFPCYWQAHENGICASIVHHITLDIPSQFLCVRSHACVCVLECFDFGPCFGLFWGGNGAYEGTVCYSCVRMQDCWSASVCATPYRRLGSWPTFLRCWRWERLVGSSPFSQREKWLMLLIGCSNRVWSHSAVLWEIFHCYVSWNPVQSFGDCLEFHCMMYDEQTILLAKCTLRWTYKKWCLNKQTFVCRGVVKFCCKHGGKSAFSMFFSHCSDIKMILHL